jgi:D-lactate dehydrogenase
MSVDSPKPQLIEHLQRIAGKKYLIVDEDKMQGYTKGYRFGSGKAMAVVKPGTLMEIWLILKACVEADVAIIMQAANTGLTGGSTPSGEGYDRPIVIISTMRIDKIQILDEGKQIVGLPGSTLFGLEELLKPYGREPHSVIGSSCIGASIVGGICNNSGGALVQRGPAYTELSLYAQIEESGELTLVNNLGIELGNTPEQILNKLDKQAYSKDDVKFPEKLASDNEYHERVRDIDADTPSRFNSDKRRLHESSGCAGKLAVFAVRMDTYPIPDRHKVFYIGTNEPHVLEEVRRHILGKFKNLPVSGEFLNDETYDVGKKFGKDTFIVIEKLGTQFIPTLFSIKRSVDRIASKFSFLPSNLSDLGMQYLSYLWPNHLPKRMESFREKYKIHLILEMSNEGIDEAKEFLPSFFKENEGDYFECTHEEGEKAILHRFSAAGAIGRFFNLYKSKLGPMMTIDVALRRNERDWLETLPQEIEEKIERKFYYGHFFCHVNHQNYIMKQGVNAKEIKNQILESFDERGAEYPAEHNVGHEYCAKPVLRDFYKELDPTNAFNPGIGQTSKLKNWK